MASLLAGCFDVEPGPFYGRSDVRIEGEFRRVGQPAERVLRELDGNVCIRDGSLLLITGSADDSQAVLLLAPGDTFAVGTYVPASIGDAPPIGTVSVAPRGGVLVRAGVTTITRITAREVSGTMDWTASPIGGDGMPDTALGTVRVRGAFTAARVPYETPC